MLCVCFLNSSLTVVFVSLVSSSLFLIDMHFFAFIDTKKYYLFLEILLIFRNIKCDLLRRIYKVTLD